MIRPRFVLRMARRESRGARRRLAFLTGAITIGVAALVAINAFTDNLRVSVNRQARELLGADLSFRSRAPLPERASLLVDSLIAPPGSDPSGARATVVSFSGMAYVPRTAGVRLVQVQAVDSGYPWYGTYQTEPAGAWTTLQTGGGGRILVDPSLLSILDAVPGDTLSLGDARFVIAGTVVNAPGSFGVQSAFGPPVWIAGRDLASTGLLQFGARAEYETYLKLPSGASAEAIAEEYRSVLRPERVRIRTVEDDREDLSDTLTRMGNYLGLVALIALLLGGLGVASAVHVFVRQRLDTIAILRCLGASAGDVFAVYLLQALVMGALGSLLGAAIGVGIQQALPGMLGDLLPVDVDVALSPRAVGLGIGLGLWVATIFALLPLAGVRRVSPLVTLRRDVETRRSHRDPLAIGTILLLGLTVVALAIIQAGEWLEGLGFAGGIVAVILVLAAAAKLLTWAVRRVLRPRWPYLLRQGLANLYRPANQTVTIVLALGFGAFLLSTLFLIQHNLLSEMSVEMDDARPNIAFYDIQPDQREGVERLLREADINPSPIVPIVPMRIRAISGRDSAARVEEADSALATRDSWAIRREYRSTYRDTLVATEQLVAGEWWDAAPDAPAGTARISVDGGVAAELGISLGDHIVWDVQGIEVRTVIASLREIDWGRLEPNFFVVFEPGSLERAPQMMATLARIDDPANRGTVQRRLAEAFPNVTSLDLSLLQNAIQNIIDRVALAIRFMAGFSLLTGAIVLIGAVSTNRFQRIREAVLLKTLGATRRQVLRIILTEYVALGLLATTISVILASVAGWALATWVFETPFRVPLPQLVALTSGLVALTLGVGLWSSNTILKRTPLEVLRSE